MLAVSEHGAHLMRMWCCFWQVARLFLVSDILHNSTAPVRNASRYRSLLEDTLPDIFQSLQVCIVCCVLKCDLPDARYLPSLSGRQHSCCFIIHAVTHATLRKADPCQSSCVTVAVPSLPASCVMLPLPVVPGRIPWRGGADAPGGAAAARAAAAAHLARLVHLRRRLPQWPPGQDAAH